MYRLNHSWGQFTAFHLAFPLGWLKYLLAFQCQGSLNVHCIFKLSQWSLHQSIHENIFVFFIRIQYFFFVCKFTLIFITKIKVVVPCENLSHSTFARYVPIFHLVWALHQIYEVDTITSMLPIKNSGTCSYPWLVGPCALWFLFLDTESPDLHSAFLNALNKRKQEHAGKAIGFPDGLLD